MYPFQFADSDFAMVGCKGEFHTHCVNAQQATCYTNMHTHTRTLRVVMGGMCVIAERAF